MNHERDILLEQLYMKYYDAVYRQCLSLVKYNPAYYPLVEDCIQDAFLQAVEDYAEYKNYKNPIGWIIRVAQNKVKSKYRDELRHSKVISPLDQAEGADVAFSVDSIESFTDRQETIETIAKIYHMLSEQEKEVFIAYFLKDMGQKETSSATGLSENSVRATIRRIRKRARLSKFVNFLHFLGAFFLLKATYK